MGLKIFLADDHKIMRDGLRVLIEKSGMSVVGEAENGQQTLDLVEKVLPDVIIMDISMPDINGIEVTRKILARYPKMKVIALSMHSDRQLVAKMLAAGASGYLLKDCAFGELAQAIKCVVKGGKYLGIKVTGVVVDDYVRHLTEPCNSMCILTGREREVLKQFAEGRNAKEIAHSLHLSAKTIEAHRRNIMKKVGVHSIAEVTKYAIREGLTSL